MKWFHQVNPEWLAERKKYLSASDVKKLIPVTATGRARANMEEANLKVWADKQCRISEEDICSQGAMARGHILEPYAITEFNKLGIVELRHWDDCLIYGSDGMSCSPDALDIIQPLQGVVAIPSPPAESHGEVKAYRGDMHYTVGLGDKMTLEERWQIATAFHVMPTLIRSFLILYNPSAKHPLFYHEYIRAELKDELEMIEKVVKDYEDYATGFAVTTAVLCPPDVAKQCEIEESIVLDLIAEADIAAGINP